MFVLKAWLPRAGIAILARAHTEPCGPEIILPKDMVTSWLYFFPAAQWPMPAGLFPRCQLLSHALTHTARTIFTGTAR